MKFVTCESVFFCKEEVASRMRWASDSMVAPSYFLVTATSHREVSAHLNAKSEDKRCVISCAGLSSEYLSDASHKHEVLQKCAAKMGF